MTAAPVTEKNHRDVWVFAEIQDHERVLEGALELITRGRELADALGERLCALVFALEAERYLPVVAQYGPDIIMYASDPALKHYDSRVVPDLLAGLVRDHRPSILLFPSTEAGADLAPRLAARFATGLTAHCTGLAVADHPEYGAGLLLMKRPAYGGNAIATVVCPKARPQMATVQQGVFVKKERTDIHARIIQVPFAAGRADGRIESLEAPLRWDKPAVPLEQAQVVVAGGRGLGSKKNFDRLYELAGLLGGETGATRVPVFNRWCGEERMIGQTGKTIRPRLYMGFGVSGQIQHTASIVESGIIVSVNSDPDTPIAEMSDYVVTDDAASVLDALIERLKAEKRD
ncbi:MAG: electron transfer flavoprotein subunit alpha/FixB family protein [Spirochaetes bacterium]|nr:electron transfer flavoprotein subunit alpha/FixB family protein [Spirochaetota bacterium]